MKMLKKTAALLLCLILTAVCLPALGETTRVVITCTGDTLLGCSERVRPNDYSFSAYVDRYGYDYPFAAFRDMFEKDDVTLLNLEVTLSDETNEKAAKSRFTFRGTTDYAKMLSQNSVEVVNLSNNHTLDYGQEGFDSTVAALESEGIGYCGSDKEDVYTWTYEKDGCRVGFVGVIPGYWVDNKKHQDKLRAACDQLKEEGCQVIVASLHCGKEYEKKHDDIHTKYERICLSLGANLIVGNHPHVPQGVNVTKGVTHLYSLGNFVFGGNTGVDEKVECIQALVAQLELVFEDGVYTGHQLTLWPIHLSGTSPENNYQPVFVTGDEAQAVMKMVQRDTEFKLNPYVDGEGAVQEFVPYIP